MLAAMDNSHSREGYQDEEYNPTGWPLTHGYHSPNLASSGHDYGGFSFNHAPLPVNNQYAAQIHQLPSHHSPLAQTWPSMLASSSHNITQPMPVTHAMGQMAAYAPPQPLPPLITTPPPPPPRAPAQPSTSRRTLTDHDRRRMCQYHEENPTVKQTEIGAMFGVERSTVSKVLRNKEKYLAQEDGSKSPIRRTKGKFPDIERALTNWGMKHQQKGMQLTDQAIREKAQFFANSVGDPDASAKVNSASWLEKFKQKNQIGSVKGRKGSGSGSKNLSNAHLTGSPTLNGISPVSPARFDGSPLVDSPEDRKKDLQVESPTGGSGRLIHSRSTTSLASGYSEASSYTSIAPPMPAIYEQQLASMSEAMQQHHNQQQQMAGNMGPPAGSNSVRPHSQCFPMLGVETSGGDMAGHYPDMDDMLSQPTMEAHQDDFAGRSLSVASLSSTDLHSHSTSMLGTPGMEHSPSVLAPPGSSLYPGSANSSSLTSPVGVVSLDDGLRGLEMAISFLGTLPSGVVDPQDYMMLGKLMEKLKGLGTPGGELPGGMHSINVKKEGERKRSIQPL